MKKIIDDIMLEARKEAESMVDKAKSDADAVIEAAKAECDAIEANEEKLRKTETDRLIKRRASARATRERSRLLEIKHDILTEETQRAFLAASKTIDDDAMLALMKRRLRAGECVMYLPKGAKKDGFVKRARALAAENGCKMTVSYDRENVKSGFVLVYGGIEENCTFEALFAEKRSEIEERAAQLLFG